MCFFAPTSHPSAARNDARNYVPCTALVVQSGCIWRQDIWLVVEDKTTHHAGGLCGAAVSKLACWPCAQALQDRLPAAHRLRYPLAQQPGLSSVRCPRAHCCWRLASVAVSSQTRWLRAGWPVALHTRGRQELEDRAGHPLSRSVPSSLCLLLLWHQHLPTCTGVTGHPLCSLTTSVSSALLPAGRAGLKRVPEGRDHQSSGSDTWHPLLARGTWAAWQRPFCTVPRVIKQHKTIKRHSVWKAMQVAFAGGVGHARLFWWEQECCLSHLTNLCLNCAWCFQAFTIQGQYAIPHPDVSPAHVIYSLFVPLPLICSGQHLLSTVSNKDMA